MSLIQDIADDFAGRVALLKRVLKELAHLPSTPALQADMNSLEHWINELGGDSRTGAHKVIREGKQRRSTCQSD